MHWMPYLKVPIYQALAGYQEVKDRPLYLDYNQNAEVTTDLVLGNLDISNGKLMDIVWSLMYRL